MPTRPRRSVLYMPGSNARAIEKAKTLPADAIIIDLEDAVAPDAKASAREQVAAAVAAGGFGRREVVVRVNGLDTPWGLDDFAAVSRAKPDAILAPKISAHTDVQRITEQIDKYDTDQVIRLWLMMETPLSVLNARDIAAGARAVGSRLSCFVMGTNDLAKDMRAPITPARTALVPALTTCVLAARAYGLVILDGVFNGVQDTEGFAASCRQGVELGFDGKTLIHPSQIEPCNEIFAPKPEEIAWARRVIAAFESPDNADKGALQLDGKMVERLHAEEAKRLVEMADTIALARA